MAQYALDELWADLAEADAAGDTQLANHIAGLIRQAEGGGAPAPEPQEEDKRIGYANAAWQGTKRAGSALLAAGFDTADEAIENVAGRTPPLGQFSGMSGITRPSKPVEGYKPDDGGVLDSATEYWRNKAKEAGAVLEEGRGDRGFTAGLFYDAASSLGPMLAAGLATAVTKNPSVGYAMFMGVGYGEGYEDAIAKGYTPGEAVLDGLVAGGAEVGGEMLGGALTKVAGNVGKSFIKDLLEVAAREAGSEVATSEINIVWDAFVRGENQGDAVEILKKFGYDGLIGALMGGGMQIVARPFQGTGEEAQPATPAGENAEPGIPSVDWAVETDLEAPQGASSPYEVMYEGQYSPVDVGKPAPVQEEAPLPEPDPVAEITRSAKEDALRSWEAARKEAENLPEEAKWSWGEFDATQNAVQLKLDEMFAKREQKRLEDYGKWVTEREALEAAVVDPLYEEQTAGIPIMTIPSEMDTFEGTERVRLSPESQQWAEIGQNLNNVPSSKEGKTGRWVVKGFDRGTQTVFAEWEGNSSHVSVKWRLNDPESLTGHPIYDEATGKTDWKHTYYGTKKARDAAAAAPAEQATPKVPAKFFNDVTKAYKEAIRRNDPMYDRTTAPKQADVTKFDWALTDEKTITNARKRAREELEQRTTRTPWLRTPEAYEQAELEAAVQIQADKRAMAEILNESIPNGIVLERDLPPGNFDFESLTSMEPDVDTFVAQSDVLKLENGKLKEGEFVRMYQLLPDGSVRNLRVQLAEDQSRYEVYVVSQQGIGRRGGKLKEPFLYAVLQNESLEVLANKKRIEDEKKAERERLIKEAQEKREAKEAEEKAKRQAENVELEGALKRYGVTDPGKSGVEAEIAMQLAMAAGSKGATPPGQLEGLSPTEFVPGINAKGEQVYERVAKVVPEKELTDAQKIEKGLITEKQFVQNLVRMVDPYFETNVKAFELMQRAIERGYPPRMLRQTLEDAGYDMQDVRGMLDDGAYGDIIGMGKVQLTQNGMRQKKATERIIRAMVESDVMSAQEIINASKLLAHILRTTNPQLGVWTEGKQKGQLKQDITVEDMEAAYKRSLRDTAPVSGTQFSNRDLHIAAMFNISPARAKEAIENFEAEINEDAKAEIARQKSRDDTVAAAERNKDKAKLAKRAPGLAKARAAEAEAAQREANFKVPIEQRTKQIEGRLVKYGIEPQLDLNLAATIKRIREKTETMFPEVRYAKQYLVTKQNELLNSGEKMSPEGRARLEAFANSLRNNDPEEIMQMAEQTAEDEMLAKELQYYEMWEEHWYQEKAAQQQQDFVDRAREDSRIDAEARLERVPVEEQGYRAIPQDIIDELRSERAEQLALMREFQGQVSEVLYEVTEANETAAEPEPETSAPPPKPKKYKGEEILKMKLGEKSEAEAKRLGAVNAKQAFYNNFENATDAELSLKADIPVTRQYKKRKGKDKGETVLFKQTGQKAKYTKAEQTFRVKSHPVSWDKGAVTQLMFDDSVKGFKEVGLPSKKVEGDIPANSIPLGTATAEEAAAFVTELAYDSIPRSVVDPVAGKSKGKVRRWLSSAWSKDAGARKEAKFLRALADMARGYSQYRVNQARDSWSQAELILRKEWGKSWSKEKDSAVNHYLQGMDADAVGQRTGYTIPEDAVPHLDRIKRLIAELGQEGKQRGTFQEPNVVAAIVNGRPYLTRLSKNTDATRDQIAAEMPGLEKLWLEAHPPLTLEEIKNAGKEELLHILRTRMPHLAPDFGTAVVDGEKYGKKAGKKYEVITYKNEPVALVGTSGNVLKDGVLFDAERLRKLVAQNVKAQDPRKAINELVSSLLNPEVMEGVATGKGSTWRIRQARTFMKSEYEQIGNYATELAMFSKNDAIKNWLKGVGPKMQSRTADEFFRLVEQKAPDLAPRVAQLRAEHALNWKIRDTINELVDPDTVISRTIDVLAENVAMSRFLTEAFHTLRSLGLASWTPQGAGWTTLAEEGSKLGRTQVVVDLDAALIEGAETPVTKMAQEMYVTQDVADAIRNMSEYGKAEDHAAWKILRRVSSVSKVTKVVFSWLGLIRNAVSTTGIHSFTSAFGHNAGYFNRQGFLEAFKEWVGGFGTRGRAWQAKSMTPSQQLMADEATKRGMTHDGGRAGAIYDLQREGFGATSERISQYHAAKRFGTKVKNAFMNTFRLGDEGVKIAAMGIEASNYLAMKGEDPSLVRKYFEKPGSLSEEQNRLVQRALDMGAEQVKNTYPTFSRIAEGMKMLSRNPVFSAFPGFHYEMARNTGHIAHDSYNLMKGVNYDGTEIKGAKAQATAKALAAYRIAGRSALAASGPIGVYLLSQAILSQLDPDDPEQREIMEALNDRNPEHQAAKRGMLPFWLQNSDVVVYGIDTETGTFKTLNVSFLNPYGGYSDMANAMWSRYKDALAAGVESPKAEAFKEGVNGIRELFFNEEPFAGSVYDRLKKETSRRDKPLASRGWADSLDNALNNFAQLVGLGEGVGNVFGATTGALVEGYMPEVFPQTEEFGRAVMELSGLFDDPEVIDNPEVQAEGAALMDRIAGFAWASLSNASGLRRRTHNLKEELPLALVFEKRSFVAQSSKFKERVTKAVNFDDESFYELFSAENAMRRMSFDRIAERFQTGREVMGWGRREFREIEADFSSSGGLDYRKFYKGQYEPMRFSDIDDYVEKAGLSREERRTLRRKYNTARRRWMAEHGR